MVSSTFSDLKEHRKRAFDVLPRQGLRPIGMEYSGANVTADVLRAALGDDHPWTQRLVANFAAFREPNSGDA